MGNSIKNAAAAKTASDTAAAVVNPAYDQLTAEKVAGNVMTAIDNLVTAFTQLEQRGVADNGKRYPLDATLPDGVEDTGEIVVVNRYQFLARSTAGAVCWKLETMLDQQEERIAQQKASIRNAVRGFEAGRVEESLLDRMCDILDSMEEQHALVLAGFRGAKAAYSDLIGEDFETKAMRQERTRASSNKPVSGAAARAARLLK